MASIPFYYDFLTWCVQKGKPISILECVTHLCTDPIIYLVFSFQSIIVTIFAYFLQMFERRPRWDILKFSVNGFACYMGFPCTYNPIRSGTRLSTIFIFFGSFLFATLLSTMTVKILTTPLYNSQIKSIDQIIENKFQLVGNMFAYQKITKQNQVNFFKLF